MVQIINVGWLSPVIDYLLFGQVLVNYGQRGCVTLYCTTGQPGLWERECTGEDCGEVRMKGEQGRNQ